jgi:hypothetical protein
MPVGEGEINRRVIVECRREEFERVLSQPVVDVEVGDVRSSRQAQRAIPRRIERLSICPHVHDIQVLSTDIVDDRSIARSRVSRCRSR